MKSNDNLDFSGADAVAKWLIDNGVTSQEFQKDPNRWLDLAIRAVKSNTEKKAVNEAGTIGGSATGSIKGFFEDRIGQSKPKRRKNKRIRPR